MKKRSLVLIVASLLLVVGCEQTTVPQAANYGRFEGDVIAQWDSDGRNMILRQDFTYIDGQNRAWRAPAGSKVNGASIPYAFWSVIGGPFEGQYRNASVVHDIGCDEMTASWEDVHRMFYEACRCGGVDETKAKMMYYAVYHFGPRWEVVEDSQVQTVTAPNGQVVQQEVPVQTVVRIDPPPPTQEELAKVEAMIVEENPSAAAIEQTNRAELRRRPRGGYRPGSTNRPEISGENAPGSNSPGGGRWTRSPESSQRGGERGGERTADSGAAQPQFSPRMRQGDPRALSDQRSAGTPSPTGSRQLQGGNVQNFSGQRALAQRATPAGACSDQECQWARSVVCQHLERQTGEARSVDCTVERTERGYRVQVQHIELDDQGQPAGYSGTSLMRLSRDGRVMEVINR